MNMNLTNIVKKIVNEDTWGNNPSAAGAMSPGKAPASTMTPPVPTGNVKFRDVKKDFTIFTSELEKQEENLKRKLTTDLSKELVNKNVTARASKGSVGQIEKDYSFSVADVSLVKLGETYYIVLKAKDGAEYFLNIDFKVKVDASSPAQQPASQSAQATPPQLNTP